MIQKIKNSILLFLILLIGLSFFGACGVTNKMPINTNSSTILRDSLILRDSTRYIDSIIYVEIPREKVMDIISQIDTSSLETSVAKSIAYVDTNSLMIIHSLENKDTVLQEKIVYKDRYVTETKIIYRDSIEIKEIPKEVEVIKTVYPKAFWYLLGFFVIIVVYVGIKIYLKFKV